MPKDSSGTNSACDLCTRNKELNGEGCGPQSSIILKKDLLTTEEVDRIIEFAATIQDRAIFCVLFDSGRRFGEIIGLRIGDVEFDTIGAKLAVDGKAGKDIVRISASAPTMTTWIDNHPARNNPAAPLWILVVSEIRQMTHNALKIRLRKAVKRAGITKESEPYLFRHSRT